MTKDELCEALHREMLFYYFAQREPRLEIRTGESLISAVWRKVQLSIQQITQKLNFSDQSAFGKFFQRRSGISPAIFRKK